MAIEPNVFYTVEQAAERMQLSVEMVKQLIRERRLRASVLGKSRAYRISGADILAFYDANATRPKEADHGQADR
ncbi:hypothetical protein B5E65_12225 [Gemmiger sp. An120]|uniref:helix-turn-helix domain-containing protein n=1 Tax=Gemmiger sp. An120 TaxID=1965549 RepID=UPI000B383D15|nr:helix-turn-helix domain-containing protein [Gemmiger sp. An120]OUQ41395.1 hypothetical protein B5E65_12225 [Gemmiger sp. An120]